MGVNRVKRGVPGSALWNQQSLRDLLELPGCRGLLISPSSPQHGQSAQTQMKNSKVCPLTRWPVLDAGCRSFRSHSCPPPPPPRVLFYPSAHPPWWRETAHARILVGSTRPASFRLSSFSQKPWIAWQVCNLSDAWEHAGKLQISCRGT